MNKDDEIRNLIRQIYDQDAKIEKMQNKKHETFQKLIDSLGTIPYGDENLTFGEILDRQDKEIDKILKRLEWRYNILK